VSNYHDKCHRAAVELHCNQSVVRWWNWLLFNIFRQRTCSLLWADIVSCAKLAFAWKAGCWCKLHHSAE